MTDFMSSVKMQCRKKEVGAQKIKRNIRKMIPQIYFEHVYFIL